MSYKIYRFLLKRKFGLHFLFAILFTILALYKFPADALCDDKLVFLGNKNIAPVVYLDNNNIPAGVAVDIVHAISKYISQPVEIRAMDWLEAQALVTRGKADALIQINETEDRRLLYDFSDSLLESQFSIFTNTSRPDISGLSGLRGLRVGVEQGGLPQQALEKNPNIRLTIIPNFFDGYKLLSEGSIDAVVVDYRVGSYILAEGNFKNIKATGEPIAFSYSSIAVKKGNTKLLDRINNGLRIIKADGTYQKIMDKWQSKETVFQTREQITKRVYYRTILILLTLLLVAIAWTITSKKELAKRKAAEEKIRQQYSTLRSIINSDNAFIFSVDRQYRYTSFNLAHAAVMQSLYGAKIEEGRSLLDYMAVVEDREFARRNLDRAMAGEQFVEEGYSGEEIRSRQYFVVSHNPIRTDSGDIIGVAVLAQDMTERKQAEVDLRRLNRELRAISDCNQVLVRSTDEQTLLNDICKIICDVAGYRMALAAMVENDEAKSVRPVAWAGVEGASIARSNITRADTEQGKSPCETAIQTGKVSFIQDFATEPFAAPWREDAPARGYRSLIALPLPDVNGAVFGVLSIYASEPNAFKPEEVRLLEELAGDLAFGISSLRTRAELDQYRLHLEELVEQRTADLEEARASALNLMEEANLQRQAAEDALAEKEVLLREVHHRVKNNLSTIATMLYFQAKKVDDPKTIAAFQESQNRIQSMARVHEHLYRSHNLATVDMKGYLSDLMIDLSQSMGTHSTRIELDAGKITLDLDHALPCGLLINELLSNALKHAFTKRKEGSRIDIRLASDINLIELSVKDNGMGLPEELDPAEVRTLGLRLVDMLVRQLQGRLEIESKADLGTAFIVSFPFECSIASGKG